METRTGQGRNSTGERLQLGKGTGLKPTLRLQKEAEFLQDFGPEEVANKEDATSANSLKSPL
jgi:hypothetical protein